MIPSIVIAMIKGTVEFSMVIYFLKFHSTKISKAIYTTIKFVLKLKIIFSMGENRLLVLGNRNLKTLNLIYVFLNFLTYNTYI